MTGRQAGVECGYGVVGDSLNPVLDATGRGRRDRLGARPQRGGGRACRGGRGAADRSAGGLRRQLRARQARRPDCGVDGRDMTPLPHHRSARRPGTACPAGCSLTWSALAPVPAPKAGPVGDIMGTGIVATATASLPVTVPGRRTAATVVWALAALLLVALTAALTRRQRPADAAGAFHRPHPLWPLPHVAQQLPVAS